MKFKCDMVFKGWMELLVNSGIGCVHFDFKVSLRQKLMKLSQ
jgi:hypothetical protein